MITFLGFGSCSLLLVASLLFAVIIEKKSSYVFTKYKRQEGTRGCTGFQVANKILNSHGISNVKIVRAGWFFSDYYNPMTSTIVLSKNSYDGTNITAISVAAHESGHAVQQYKGYFFVRVRNLMCPVVSFASNVSWVLIMFGLSLGFFGLIKLGVFFFFITLIFQIVTIPVEYDASKRAWNTLEYSGLVSNNELVDVKKALNAAALTYVASTIVSLSQFLRYVCLLNQNKRRSNSIDF